MILCGGLSYDTVGRRACLTVMHGKSTAVLEMDYSIVDFLTLCETPYPNGKSLPHLSLDFPITFTVFVTVPVKTKEAITCNKKNLKKKKQRIYLKFLWLFSYVHTYVLYIL